MDVLEWLVELCAPCTGNSPVPGTGPGGGAGPFGSAGSSSGGGGPPPDKGPSPCDQLGGGGNDPDAQDIAEAIGGGVATDAGADIAAGAAARSGGSGAAAGVLGVLGTLVSGSETGARGYINIKCSKGRGLGGGSRAAQEAFDQIAADRANNEALARQMAGGN